MKTHRFPRKLSTNGGFSTCMLVYPRETVPKRSNHFSQLQPMSLVMLDRLTALSIHSLTGIQPAPAKVTLP